MIRISRALEIGEMSIPIPVSFDPVVFRIDLRDRQEHILNEAHEHPRTHWIAPCRADIYVHDRGSGSITTTFLNPDGNSDASSNELPVRITVGQFEKFYARGRFGRHIVTTVQCL